MGYIKFITSPPAAELHRTFPPKRDPYISAEKRHPPYISAEKRHPPYISAEKRHPLVVGNSPTTQIGGSSTLDLPTASVDSSVLQTRA